MNSYETSPYDKQDSTRGTSVFTTRAHPGQDDTCSLLAGILVRLVLLLVHEAHISDLSKMILDDKMVSKYIMVLHYHAVL